jgi:hypothetical protein
MFFADLESDPGETTNRAAEHPEVTQDLGRRLDSWVAAHGGRR